MGRLSHGLLLFNLLLSGKGSTEATSYFRRSAICPTCWCFLKVGFLLASQTACKTCAYFLDIPSMSKWLSSKTGPKDNYSPCTHKLGHVLQTPTIAPFRPGCTSNSVPTFQADSACRALPPGILCSRWYLQAAKMVVFLLVSL